MSDVELVMSFIELAWNRGDEAAAEKLLGPRFQHHDLVTHAESDTSAYLGSITALRSMFASVELRIRDIFGTDGRIGSRWTAIGTHRSGMSVEINGLSIDHVVNGRISENWTAWDLTGLQQQLPGVLGREDSG